MKNLDLDNMNNLDESFSNFGNNVKLKDYFTKEAIRAALLSGGPHGAIFEAQRQAGIKAKALANAQGAEKEIAQAELEIAKADLERANQLLVDEQSKSSKAGSDNSGSNSGGAFSLEKTGMNPTLKWSLIGGGILVVLVGGFFAIRYFKNK